MFRKLLKYDLRYVYKVLVFFYVITLICAALARLCLEIDNSAFINFIGLILRGTAITLIVSLIFNNLMRCWARFITNTYGDESYLTHTLPVKTSTVYATKFTAGLITLLTSILISVATLLILFYSKENLEMLQQVFNNSLGGTTSFSFWEAVIMVLVIFFLEMFCLLNAGYLGSIMGHMMHSRKMLWLILFSLVCYGVTQVITLLAVYILGLFDSNIMALFTSQSLPIAETIRILLYAATFIYLAWTGIYYTASELLLRRGVNID